MYTHSRSSQDELLPSMQVLEWLWAAAKNSLSLDQCEATIWMIIAIGGSLINTQQF